MNKFMEIYQTLLNNKNNDSILDITDKIINKLEENKNKSYRRNFKYTNKQYLCGIIEVLKNNISWRKYTGAINGRILNNKHNYYSKIGIYDELS